MQVTLKQSDIHILTQSHPHTHMYIHTLLRQLWLFVSVLRFCECFRNELKALALHSNRRIASCPPSHRPNNYTQIHPSPRCSSRGQIFCLAKVKATIVFSVFVLFSPFAVPSEKLSTFCSRLAARLVPLFNFIVRLSVCLFVCHFCLLWCPWSVMIIIDNNAVEGRKGGGGGGESEKRSQVINNSIYRQLSANNEKFNKNIHTHMYA